MQTIRGRFFQPRLRFASIEELNGWLEAECLRWAATHAHPEQKELTVAEALELERPALQPMLAGTVRISVCGRAVEHYAAMALMKRSPNRTANWAFAMDHSRGGILHSFSERLKIR